MAGVWSPQATCLSLRNPARHFSSMSELSPLEFKPVDTDERTDSERPARLDVRTNTVEIARWHAAAHDAGMLLSEWVRMTLNAEAIEGEVVSTELSAAEGSAVIGANRAARKQTKAKVCIHGTEKDYRCWQCGGLARVE